MFRILPPKSYRCPCVPVRPREGETMADVLVADGDGDRREMTTRLLDAARHTVYPAPDGATFHSLLRISPAPLVAVVQLDAPEMAHALLALLPAESATPPPQLLAPPTPTPTPSFTPTHTPTAAADAVPRALRHAYILVAEESRARLLAAALVRLRPAYARYMPIPRTTHDAVLLLAVVNEAAEALCAL